MVPRDCEGGTDVAMVAAWGVTETMTTILATPYT